MRARAIHAAAGIFRPADSGRTEYVLTMPAAPSQARRIIDIALDEESVARRTPEVEHERAVALFDLLEENDFCLVEGEPGPYHPHIGIFEQRLVFGVRAADER